MFVIQYQQLQKAKWHDDPYFEHKNTIKELKLYFKYKLTKIDKPNKDVRYRIIKRVTKDVFISKLTILN